MIRWKPVIAAAVVLAAATAWTTSAPAQAPNPGAAEMVLDGGTTGKVPFPHRKHQQALTDCTLCHSVFPQKAGAIEELKEGGKLPRKQVMNELCTRCHKDAQAAGKPSGPTSCLKCHVKG